MMGFLNIDKPKGATSHDVISRVRYLAKIKQVGHAGTLDPMATGVLPVALGKACRLIRFLDSDKTYLAEIRLGICSDTDDVTGNIEKVSCSLPTREKLGESLFQFQGVIEQAPPSYSAVHVNGERLYKLARSGQVPVDVPTRVVQVYKLDLLDYEDGLCKVRIHCSAGTYIRSIARDLGRMLETGGCLESLVREQAGSFCLTESQKLPPREESVTPGAFSLPVISPLCALTLEQVKVDREVAVAITQGKQVKLDGTTLLKGDYVLVLKDDMLIAVCRVIKAEIMAADMSDPGPQVLKPEVVLVSGTEVG